MGKRILCIALILLLAAALFACQPNPEAQNSMDMGVAPVDPDYYTSAQMYSGGVASAGGVNVKSVSISHEEESTAIRIGFLYGSKYSGVDEAMMDYVPQYRVYCLPNPHRLVVEVQNVDYWDWEKARPEDLKMKPFYGLFNKIPYETGPYTLFFQLTDEMSYQVEEQVDELILRLKPQGKQQTSLQYYVLLQAYYEYQEGKILSDWNFTPTLCADLDTKTLISSPFAQEQDAQAFMQRALSDMESVVAKEMFSVVALPEGELPDADRDGDPVSNKPVVLVNGEERQLPVDMTDGTYLCSLPAQQQMLFSVPADAQEDYFVRLCTMEPNGKRSMLGQYTFYPILQAEYSPDGGKLALLDLDRSGVSTLYCIDLSTTIIENLSESGGFTYTSGFAWAGQDVLYSISGTETMDLVRIDFTASESGRFKTYPRVETSLGTIEHYHNELYLLSTKAGGTGTVYETDLYGKVKKPIADGVLFKVGAGGNLAVLQPMEDMQQYRLVIYSLANGDDEVVARDVLIPELRWSMDGNTLYYMGRSGNALYPYTLYAYDVAGKSSKAICDTYVSSFNVTALPGILMLMEYGALGSRTMSTYRLDTQNL